MKSKEEVEKIDAAEEKDSYFIKFDNFSDVPESFIKQGHANQLIRETMFTNFYDDEILQQLKDCRRVMPHHQNTSGFFITILQKTAPFDKKEKIEKKPKVEKNTEPEK